jgi:hypothetical protein
MSVPERQQIGMTEALGIVLPGSIAVIAIQVG